MLFDPSTAYGARVERRLREEWIIWLTTVRADGVPQPSPVWFLWDGESFLIYSQAGRQKLRNIRVNPRVALSFDSDGRGGNIVVFDGEAAVVADAPPATDVPAYLEKYAQAIERINMTPEQFAASYDVAIRVRPSRVRGH